MESPSSESASPSSGGTYEQKLRMWRDMEAKAEAAKDDQSDGRFHSDDYHNNNWLAISYTGPDMSHAVLPPHGGLDISVVSSLAAATMPPTPPTPPTQAIGDLAVQTSARAAPEEDATTSAAEDAAEHGAEVDAEDASEDAAEDTAEGDDGANQTNGSSGSNNSADYSTGNNTDWSTSSSEPANSDSPNRVYRMRSPASSPSPATKPPSKKWRPGGDADLGQPAAPSTAGPEASAAAIDASANDMLTDRDANQKVAPRSGIPTPPPQPRSILRGSVRHVISNAKPQLPRSTVERRAEVATAANPIHLHADSAGALGINFDMGAVGEEGQPGPLTVWALKPGSEAENVLEPGDIIVGCLQTTYVAGGLFNGGPPEARAGLLQLTSEAHENDASLRLVVDARVVDPTTVGFVKKPLLKPHPKQYQDYTYSRQDEDDNQQELHNESHELFKRRNGSFCSPGHAVKCAERLARQLSQQDDTGDTDYTDVTGCTDVVDETTNSSFGADSSSVNSWPASTYSTDASTCSIFSAGSSSASVLATPTMLTPAPPTAPVTASDALAGAASQSTNATAGSVILGQPELDPWCLRGVARRGLQRWVAEKDERGRRRRRR